MRNAVRLAVLVSGASIVASATFLVACGDDTEVTLDAGGSETGVDGSKPPGDSGGDTSTLPDSGPETGAFDGGYTVATLDSVIGAEFCKSLARCCYGTPTPGDGGADGGTFDPGKCLEFTSAFGFEGSNVGAQLKAAGNIEVDQQAADDCVKKIGAMSCNLPGTEFKEISTACFAAFRGKLANGSACNAGIECQPTSFCKANGDASSAGVCTPLRGAGAPCGDFTNDPAAADRACSHRRSGDTGRFCDVFDVNGLRDAGDWKCMPAVAVGAECSASNGCANSTCQAPGICATPDRYFDQSCGRFLKP